MKCLILAGGSGDRLWPLSRKNHPKQFMEIRKGRSIFQETILRNIPFCDEFIIITNEKYESIVKGQLQDFQDLKYSILLETMPLKTAPSVVTLALNFDGDDELLIVSTDNIIDGDYNMYITKLKEIVKEDKIAALVSCPKDKPSGNHYFDCSGGKIKYSTVWNKYSCIDCGVLGAKVSVFLNSVEPAFVEQCKNMSITGKQLKEPESDFIGHLSIADVLKTDNFELVKTKLTCTRIVDMNAYYSILDRVQDEKENIIEDQCKDVKIINMADDRLVVANGLKDIIITNTKDAVYIAKADSKKGVKEITETYYENKKKFFDDAPLTYQDWGYEETLSLSDDYKVSKIVVFPKTQYEGVADKSAFVSFFMTEGMANVGSKKSKDYKLIKPNENFSFKGGEEYKINNNTKSNITLIKVENKKSVLGKALIKPEEGCFVKLKPSLKDFIWGGTKIRDVLGKTSSKKERIAESWELSAHSAGQSKIATGKFKGHSFADFIEEIGKENLGWKAQGYERFPIMIKFIDARESLSIQVHPDDSYAFPHEGDYGKNEMWYIMSAEKDACIYIGFTQDVTKDEIIARIQDNTLLQIMNKVSVKKGETYFLKAGTVHAIGAGCMVCEIQQSSNVTYRLFDYGRLNYNGKPRELHVNKALEVAEMHKAETVLKSHYSTLEFSGYKKQLLGQCKYFTAAKYVVDGELSLAANGASFRAVVVIEGEGKIGNDNISMATKLGDTWFAGSKEVVNLKGKLTVIVVNV
ncbi:MAG: hypothetical protein MJ066_00860 [Clostridia bacterium]|nr:hypothetical protein [Clostridia bacterium]